MNLVEKLSSYHILTNFIPGAVFIEILRASGFPVLSSKQVAAWIVVSYVLGAVSSRIGSIATEPMLKKIRNKSGNTYEDFVHATRTDPKIDIFVESANLYRTFVGCSILYISICLVFWIYPYHPNNNRLYSIIGVILGGGLFSISYQKQMKYVSQRVTINK